MPLDRLAVADTTFLRLDSPTTPMTIGVVMIFDGAPLLDERGRFRLDRALAVARANAHVAPRNRQRPTNVPFGLGRPVWTDVPEFDHADHISAVTAPAPTREALYALAAEFFAVPLDPERPLWENRFVDGLFDGSVALLTKIHHAVLDGGSGLETFASIFALDDAVTPPPDPLPWTPTPAPSGPRLVADAVAHQGRHLAVLGRHAVRAIRRPRRALRRARRLGRAVGPFLGRRRPVPRLPFNRPVGARRRIATVALSLEEAKVVRGAFGCTVNDVLVAAVAGGVRRLLVTRGQCPPGTGLTMMCPVSNRAAGDTRPGNQSTAMVVTVDLDEPDPVTRLAAVHAATGRAKDDAHAADLDLLLELCDFVIPPMLGGAVRKVHDQEGFNLSVSNLAGLPVPVWYQGARLREFYPIAPLMKHLGVAVTAFSHAGTLFVGVNADADSVPDVDVLTAGMAAELSDLVARARSADPA